MYKNILIAIDGSNLAGNAVKTGVELAKSLGSAVTIVTVTEGWSAREVGAKAERDIPNPVEQFEEMMAKDAQEVLAAAVQTAAQNGLKCEQVHVKDGYPASGILETAKEKGSDLIVMASHGRRGLGKILLGSVTSEVLAHSSLPVLVCK